MRPALFLCLLPGLLGRPAFAQPAPEALHGSISVRAVATGLNSPLRLAVEPGGEALVWLTYDGRLHRLVPPYAGQTPVVIATPPDHGISGLIQGMAIGPDGTFYLVANQPAGGFTTAIIRRGRRDGGGAWTWETVAQTEPYPRSNTPYDHSFNGVVVSPDGQHLFVNSGSRTDHGEVQSNGGQFPGVREVPLTSAILRIPTAARNLLLRNDEAFLREGGYLFADGVRNSFDLAFDAGGRLFGTENAGDRDDPEELNWLREGRHYGFPWRMGLNRTPMQFPGYDPSQDRLLNPASTAVRGGFFYNDPSYPAPPPGLAFTDPILNRGPEANRIREVDGTIRRAGETPFGTFTTHRSPLGLVYDPTRLIFGSGQHGAFFVLSWTGTESELLAPFGDEGEDLLHVDLTPADDGFEARVTRLVKGFINPIDAVMARGNLYVIEFSQTGTLWELKIVPVDGSPVDPPSGVSAWRVRLIPEPVRSGAGVLSFSPPTAQSVRVEVYTLLGQREAVLFDGPVAAGETKSVGLEGAGLAAGVHVLRIVGARETVARPFVVR